MRAVASILAVILVALGVIFVAGSQGQGLRIGVGIVLLVTAVSLVAAARLRPRVERQEIVQRIDLPGSVSLEALTCRQCGAGLAKESISVKAGGVFVGCPYCGSTYQIEEEPKW